MTEIGQFVSTVQDQSVGFNTTVAAIGPRGPQGEKGEQGPKGDPALTVHLGSMAMLQPDQTAYVANVGTDTDLILDFGIPRGEKGDVGAQGPKGDPALTVHLGSVTMLQPDQTAYVANVGTDTDLILDFGIPRGQAGDSISFLYNCTGVNDNVTISNMVNDFLNAGGIYAGTTALTMKLVIAGEVGLTASPSLPNTSYFYFANTVDRGASVQIDWSGAVLPTLKNQPGWTVYVKTAVVANQNIYHHACKCDIEADGFSDAFNGNGYYINCNGIARGTTASRRASYGFRGDGHYIDCIGSAINYEAYGFSGNGHYINCRGTGKGSNGYTAGFSSAKGRFVNCVGNGEGNSVSYGFGGQGGHYVNCHGTGVGAYAAGFGFQYNATATCIDCVGLGYTPTGTDAYGFLGSLLYSGSFLLIQNCICPRIAKAGYNTTPTDVHGINIGTSSNIGCHISGCAVSTGMGAQITSPPNVEGKTYTGNNITALSITSI